MGPHRNHHAPSRLPRTREEAVSIVMHYLERGDGVPLPDGGTAPAPDWLVRQRAEALLTDLGWEAPA